MDIFTATIISAFCATLALANDVERCEQRMSHDACLTLLTK